MPQCTLKPAYLTDTKPSRPASKSRTLDSVQSSHGLERLISNRIFGVAARITIIVFKSNANESHGDTRHRKHE
jgi:hypothetical protein